MINLINQQTKTFVHIEDGNRVGVTGSKEDTSCTFTVHVPGGKSVHFGAYFTLKSSCNGKYLGRNSAGEIRAEHNSEGSATTKFQIFSVVDTADRSATRDFTIVGIKSHDGHWLGTTSDAKLLANRRAITDGSEVLFSIYKLTKSHPVAPQCGGSGGLKSLGLHSGWAPYGHGYVAPKFVINGNICVVSGLIKGTGTHLTTLPVGCRPNKRIIFNLNNHQNTLRVDVLVNGQVHRVAGTFQHGWINLDGIQFSVRDHKPVALHNGWGNYGHDYKTATYTKYSHICEVEGLIKGSKWGHAMAVLPSNCRPRKRLIFNLNNHAKTCRVDVQTNGHVTWHAGGRDHSWVSLGGIMFATDAGRALPLANRWANYGGSYGSATVTKQQNLCLVSGLVRSGHWGHAMVTLPTDCRAGGRLIFNMNNHGKTARVDVLSNGQVIWVAGGKDHHWISLTGIVIPTSS
jgi:hypothetical protein